MIAKIKGALLLIITACLCTGLIKPAIAEEEKLIMKESEITVTGRLVLQPRKKLERLVLFGKNGRAYALRGDFNEVLKNLLNQYGENNLISVTGIADNLYDVGCRIKHAVDQDGNKKTENECIRYYHLNVAKINEAKQSDEKMPPPERDRAEEGRARTYGMTRQQAAPISSLMTTNATIKSLNLQSPIKTLTILYLDKDNKDVTKDLLLTSDTRIAKKNIETSEPIPLDPAALTVGQKIYIEFTSSDIKNEALFITILKE